MLKQVQHDEFWLTVSPSPNRSFPRSPKNLAPAYMQRLPHRDRGAKRSPHFRAGATGRLPSLAIIISEELGWLGLKLR
jgi:hypothetical protein